MPPMLEAFESKLRSLIGPDLESLDEDRTCGHPGEIDHPLWVGVVIEPTRRRRAMFASAVRSASSTRPTIIVLAILGLLSVLTFSCSEDVRDNHQASDAGTDTDGDTDTDTDVSTDTNTDNCTGIDSWYDPATDLCWQNQPLDDFSNWDESIAYCSALSLGGHDDWRLPLIQELISLIRGCVDTNATDDLSISECGVR